MKSFAILVTFLSVFSAHASELELQECSFKRSLIDFTPSSALTVLLKKEVKGSVVYKVKYKRGQTVVGPRYDLAVMEEAPGKSLIVNFFEHDEEDGVVYSKNIILIDLKDPVSVDAPVIKFNSALNDEDVTEGKCSLMF